MHSVCFISMTIQGWGWKRTKSNGFFNTQCELMEALQDVGFSQTTLVTAARSMAAIRHGVPWKSIQGTEDWRRHDQGCCKDRGDRFYTPKKSEQWMRNPINCSRNNSKQISEIERKLQLRSKCKDELQSSWKSISKKQGARHMGKGNRFIEVYSSPIASTVKDRSRH